MICAYCFEFCSQERCPHCNRYTINFLEPDYAVSDFLLEKNHVLPHGDHMFPLKFKGKWINKRGNLPYLTDVPDNCQDGQIVEPWNGDLAEKWLHPQWNQLVIYNSGCTLWPAVQENAFIVTYFSTLQVLYDAMYQYPIVHINNVEIAYARFMAGLEQRIKK